jgi:hypothetical protein
MRFVFRVPIRQRYFCWAFSLPYLFCTVARNQISSKAASQRSDAARFFFARGFFSGYIFPGNHASFFAFGYSSSHLFHQHYRGVIHAESLFAISGQTARFSSSAPSF